MTLSQPNVITLEAFKKLPETEPASEYLDGQIVQKLMPKGRHSRLQSKLCASINHVAERAKVAYAFPELRCSFGTRSIVADVAIFCWARIPFTDNGEVPDNFDFPPDWMIEILSPGQNPNRVIGNILYCLEAGTDLGWLVDPEDRSVLIFLPHQQPLLKPMGDSLPILEDIDLTLSVEQVMGWLKMNA